MCWNQLTHLQSSQRKRAKEDIGLKKSYHYLSKPTKFQIISINQISQELSKIMISVLLICLKCALMRISWNSSAVNHRSMLLKKVNHNTKLQLRNCTSILEYCSSLVMQKCSFDEYIGKQNPMPIVFW